jgi:hypothetical protein
LLLAVRSLSDINEYLLMWKTAPKMADNMRFVAKHIDLSIHTQGVTSDTHPFDSTVLCGIARDSLQYVLDNKTAEGPYLPRTICAMIYWAGLLLLKVC